MAKAKKKDIWIAPAISNHDVTAARFKSAPFEGP